MVHDRMQELRDSAGYQKNGGGSQSSLQRGYSQDRLQPFFDVIASIRLEIDMIVKDAEHVAELHQRAITEDTPHVEGEETELEAAMADTQTKLSDVKNKLQALDAENKKSKKLLPATEQRIRETQHASVVKRFSEAVTQYNEIQKTFKDKNKAMVKRQYLIVNPDASPAELEEVASGDGGQSVFKQATVNAQQYAAAAQALEEVQARHRDIMKIEKSLLELQQLFVDMSVLVAEQGEVLIQIDKHLDAAVDYTEKGADELVEAGKLQQGARKKMCFLFFGILILAIIGVVVYFVTNPGAIQDIANMINGARNGGEEPAEGDEAAPDEAAG